MSDARHELQGLFGGTDRFRHFGEMLLRMHVQGFRCHINTSIEVLSPITAFCGLNGTGKSTLLQLAATAYNGHYQCDRLYIRQFIIQGTLDAKAIQPGAKVIYEYSQAPGSHPGIRLKTVTVKRKLNWTGYYRQPKRKVFYGGVGFCLPRVEEMDFITAHASSLIVQHTTDVSPDIRQRIGQVLGVSYGESKAHRVGVRGRSRGLLSVGRDGSSYSEINMGFGEGRICRLICELEALPERSLILLEEPEISLHPSAQHELGRYLVDLCIRRKDQVLLTTHSEYLLQALPQMSRLYLHKTPSGVCLIPGVSVAQATSLLSAQHKKALHVLVEDCAAEHIVTELLRKHDPIFLKTVRITRIGSKQDIQTVMKALRDMGVSACAVRDADVGLSGSKDNLFRLFGTMPPEKEIFQSASFGQLLLDRFGLRIEDVNLQLSGKDHHEWFKELSQMIPFNYQALLQAAADAYLISVSEPERTSLIQQLKAALK
jgi:hypothetical protein